MIGPSTRGKRNATTLGKSSNQDWEATEDSNPNEELSKVKEEVKKDVCDLQGDISDRKSMLSTYMNEKRSSQVIKVKPLSRLIMTQILLILRDLGIFFQRWICTNLMARILYNG